MKHLKTYREIFESTTSLTKRQINWLNKCTEGAWTLNSETGLVDVDGGFYCSSMRLNDFKGVRFGKVSGDFNCSRNTLTSLEGAPQEVGGNFGCHNNNLTSLEGAPREVGWDFYCFNNPVSETTLKKIWNEMKSGFTYSESLKRVATDIPKEDWDLLDKSGVELDDKFLKGASVLRRFL